MSLDLAEGELILRCKEDDRELATRQAIEKLQAFLDEQYGPVGSPFTSSKKPQADTDQ